MITWNIYVLELQEKKSWKYSYLSWYGWNSVLINPKHYAKLTCYHPGNHCGKKKKKVLLVPILQCPELLVVAGKEWKTKSHKMMNISIRSVKQSE